MVSDKGYEGHTVSYSRLPPAPVAGLPGHRKWREPEGVTRRDLSVGPKKMNPTGNSKYILEIRKRKAWALQLGRRQGSEK